ncbi:MAG TPA: tRNA (adenosine(37)-N6)-dimethylallyltransferase MiaA [Verrucomicrobiales bacterium]|nr:tRNA (adenosine(37)-N6)-dimethylallyltransferase MiaA [Verrucomicrobiales bacterium]
MDGRAERAELPPGTFVLTGPTGCGKSDAGAALAAQWEGEIVNADAFQLYRGWPLLTAAPGEEALRRVKHHLYACVDLDQEMSAARFRQMALPVIWDIAGRGGVPIVVGGSGLYVKALTHGLSGPPGGDAGLRHELGCLDTATVRSWLAAVDPEAAQQVDPANRRYLERALEMVLLSGKPVSEVKQGWNGFPRGLRAVCLLRERSELYARIDRRVQSMLERGLVEEVRALGQLSATAEKAIGVREIRGYLEGNWDLPEAVRRIQQASRRYAKRQMTWFRRETWMQTVCAGAEEDAMAVARRITALIEHGGRTRAE